MRLVALSLLLVVIALPLHAGTLYRWVDSDGVRHMETLIPPEEAQNGYEVVDDRSFRVIQTVPRALTGQELEAETLKQEAKAQQQREVELAARHDRTLLSIYTTVEDMEMARDGQLETLESIRGSIKETLAQMRKNLDDMIASAAGFERDGRPVPPKLLTDIETTKKQVAVHEQSLTENRAKQDEVVRTFTLDIARFKALKGIE